MNKFMVEIINDLSEIYASIQERIRNGGELFESDIKFMNFYKTFTNDVFDFEKRRKVIDE